MADGIDLKIDIQDFRRQLQEVGTRMEKNIVTAGARAAAAVFQKAARQFAPVLKKRDARRVPGALRRAISVGKSRRQTNKSTIVYKAFVRAGRAVRGRNEDAFYWYFLERGWIRRSPRPRGERRVSRASLRAAARTSGAATHKFPFFAPAFSSSGSAAVKAFSDRVAVGIARVNKEVK